MTAGIGVFLFWCHSSIKPYLPFRVMCTGLTLSLAPLTNAALALLLVCGVVTTGGNVLLIILFWQTFQIMLANWGNGVVVNSCVCHFSRRAGGQHALRPTSDQEHLPKLSGGSGGLDMLLLNFHNISILLLRNATCCCLARLRILARTWLSGSREIEPYLPAASWFAKLPMLLYTFDWCVWCAVFHMFKIKGQPRKIHGFHKNISLFLSEPEGRGLVGCNSSSSSKWAGAKGRANGSCKNATWWWGTHPPQVCFSFPGKISFQNVSNCFL